jgi:hypothetical protein
MTDNQMIANHVARDIEVLDRGVVYRLLVMGRRLRSLRSPER